MANLAQTLKQEIARIARKELRGETTALKKQSARYRSDIASLKKQVNTLERQLRSAMKESGRRSESAGTEDEGGGTKLRFRAAGLAGHRQRLGLSAREAAQLMGVSQLTVFKWEKGQTHPRASQMPAIAAFRRLGRREALRQLDK